MCRPNASRSRPSTMLKFPDDVRQAELITGGNPDICDDPKFKSKTDEKTDTKLSEPDSESLKTPKSAIKRTQNGSVGEPSRKHIRFSLPPQKSGTPDAEASTSRASSSKSASRARSSQRHVKSRSASSSSGSKKPLFERSENQTPVRPISQEMAEKIRKKNYQSNIRIQPNSTNSSPPVNKEKLYTCFRCFDTTNRLSLLIDHYRAHEQHGMNVPPMSPKVPKPSSSTPGPSRESNSSSPRVKNEKHKTKTSANRKSNSETPTKKKPKRDRDETPKSESGDSSSRSPSVKKKQKKLSKSKHAEVDQNKVLREKILKDWDDESDEDLSSGSKVFSTTAEIHTSAAQLAESPVSPPRDSNTSGESIQESNEMETTVSSTNDIISSDVSCSKDDHNNEVRRENVVSAETAKETFKEEEKSCFDFEDNDDAINLDKSHKFGQKLPRVINEDKVKKSATTQGIENESNKQIQSSLEEDGAVMEKIQKLLEEDSTVKIQELLESSKMSDVPDVPKSFLIKTVDKKKKEGPDTCAPQDKTGDGNDDERMEKLSKESSDDANLKEKELANEIIGETLPEKNGSEISQTGSVVEEIESKDVEDVFSQKNKKDEKTAEESNEVNVEKPANDVASEKIEASNSGNLTPEKKFHNENSSIFIRDQGRYEPTMGEEQTLDGTIKDDEVVLNLVIKEGESQVTVKNDDIKETLDLESDELLLSQNNERLDMDQEKNTSENSHSEEYVAGETSHDDNREQYPKKDVTEHDETTLKKNTEIHLDIDFEELEKNKVNDRVCENKIDLQKNAQEQNLSIEKSEVKKQEIKEIEIPREEDKEEIQVQDEINEDEVKKPVVGISESLLEKESMGINEIVEKNAKENLNEQNKNSFIHEKVNLMEQNEYPFIHEKVLGIEQDVSNQADAKFEQGIACFEGEDVLNKNKKEPEDALSEFKKESNFEEVVSVKEVTSIDINKQKVDKEEVKKESSNDNLLAKVDKRDEQLEIKEENSEYAAESEKKQICEIEMGSPQDVFTSKIGLADVEQVEVINENRDLLIGNTLSDFNTIKADAIEIPMDSTITATMETKDEVGSEIGVKEEKSDLTENVNVRDEIKITEALVPSQGLITKIEENDAEEAVATSAAKGAVSNVSFEASNINLPKTEAVIKVEKYYSVPELGAYNNELMNVPSDLHQWTAMEYYADLEAQVRNDMDSEDTKKLDTHSTNLASGISKETTSEESKKDGLGKTTARIEKESDVQDKAKLRGSAKSKKPHESSEVRDRSKTDNESLNRDKTSDCSKSGVIYDFKLDFPDQTVNEIPTRISKVKKRKWESKERNDVGMLENESPNAEVTETKLEEQREDELMNDIVKGNIKAEEPGDSKDNISHLDYMDVASKKLKLDMGCANEPTFKDDLDAMSTEVRDEITISQDTGMESEEIKEVIVSTSEEVMDTVVQESSLKPSEFTIASSKIIEGPISGALSFNTVSGKEDLPSVAKLNLNLTTPEKIESDKKETSTTSFDPSQIELDINSMPVVIEEDLMQDIKLPSINTTVNPPNSTRTNMKQIRIQLRKAGENNSSLLQGTQNGKIIRIPGTSKEPVTVKKNQVASTSKLQTIPTLITQRAVSSGNQTMLLKMNPIQNSGQAKYAVGKNQIRTTTALTTSGASGQPVKVHIIQQTQQQNTKLIMQPQQKPFTGKLSTTRMLSKSQANTGITGSKALTTKSGQKVIINQKRQIISGKNIIGKTATLNVPKATTVAQKNTKSVTVTKPMTAQPTKNMVLPAVQGTSGAAGVQVVTQTATPKVIVQRRTKSVAGTIAPVKALPSQTGTIFIHTSQGLVPASKAVTKQILNQIPQIPAQSSPRPTAPTVTNLKRPPVNKSRQANVNILQRSPKKNNRQQGPTQTTAQQQGKQQVLSIPVSSISSHELILNNVPVQFQNLGTAQPDLKMLYLVDEHGQYHQVDNSPLIAIDNSGDNRSVFIESNSTNEVDNLFLTFGESNVTTSASTPSQDILAKALANTQVLQSDTADISDTIETPTLYVEPQYPAPTLTHNVLETSFSLNPPIMTPLEVPSSVSPQVTTMSSNLLPATTVVEQTLVKKPDAQPSMPLLTDDVEVATGQAVYLNSSTLVSGTSQPLTFQVINSDGNIVVASAPTSSPTITNPVSSNKTASQVLFSTDLLKSESRHSNKTENIAGNVEHIVTSVATGLNVDEGITLSLENNQQDSAISVGSNRQVIQSSKITRVRDKKPCSDSTHSDKQVKNIVELGDINKQKGHATDNLDAVHSSNSDEILQNRLQQDSLLEKRDLEEKATTQQSRTGLNTKTLSTFTYAQPIVTAENESKFIVEEKR